MINLIDYILDLFRDENHAQAFVANPDQALADAGLSTVSSAQLQSVAATAIPSLAMGGSGDPVADLQQAVSSHYGFEPSYCGPARRHQHHRRPQRQLRHGRYHPRRQDNCAG